MIAASLGGFVGIHTTMAGARPATLDLIKRLVAFDTTSRNSNLALIRFVADYLSGHGIEATVIGDESGEKANLFATLGPAGDGGIVLSGHTDVVPVDGQEWSSDPFEVVHADARLYGRGTADMKSFIATVLALVPEFQAANLNLPIHLAFSYDEEVGCLGVHGLVRHIDTGDVRPRLVLIGEPTEMKVANAHKGIRAFHTTVTGLEAHSSATHRGVNAIEYAARLIGFLGDVADEMKARADPASRFEPPYVTISVGTMHGGTALNIIPRQCSFDWEYRLLPDDDEDEIFTRFSAFAEDEVLPRMRAVAPEAAIVTVPHARVPALRPAEGSPAEALILALAESNQTHVISFGTEGGIYQEAGIPTVVCGPGNIAQAHKPDEFIALDQIAACERFLRRLIDYASGGAVR